VIIGMDRGGLTERAGLHVGYIITSIDGKTLSGPAELEIELQNRAPGTKIRLGYMFRSSALGSRTYYPNQAILVVPPR
jgi:S1-C subfamily serine protease